MKYYKYGSFSVCTQNLCTEQLYMYCTSSCLNPFCAVDSHNVFGLLRIATFNSPWSKIRYLQLKVYFKEYSVCLEPEGH